MIRSVQKAMRLLSFLADAGRHPVTLSELSARSGYPKPTCAHLLETLCADGYVERVSHTEGYLLGPSCYYLTRYGRYGEELVTLCRPVMRWMEKNSHATVVLSVIRSGRKFIIEHMDSEQGIFREHPSIRTDDIYRTATGRAILAYMDQDEVRMLYETCGAPPRGHWDEVDSYEALVSALQRIRTERIVTTGRRDGEAVGYACPLFRRGRCVGAIGLARVPHDQDPLKDRQEEELLRRVLLRGVREIERRLSYEA